MRYTDKEHTQVTDGTTSGPVENFITQYMNSLMIPYPQSKSDGSAWDSDEESDAAYAEMRILARDEFLAGIELYRKYATIDEALADILPKIKLKAESQILGKYPIWKQLNKNSRSDELNNLQFSRTLTESENNEIIAIAEMRTWIKSIRTKSNNKEAEVGAMSFEELNAYDVDAAWEL